LTAPKLIIFIIVHHPTFKTKASISNLRNPKTALADAERGVTNLLSVAFGCRTNKSRQFEVAAPVAAVQTVEAPERSSSPAVFHVDLNPRINDVKPSQLLRDPAWLSRLWSVFDPADRFAVCIVDDALCKKADLLLSLLHTRLAWHTRNRVLLSNQEHWCLEWARRNFAVVAAYMVLLNHIKRDISRIRETKCLLAPPNSITATPASETPIPPSTAAPLTRGYSAAANFLFCTNSEARRQGCYLHFNVNGGEWIRSGKVTGPNRDFEVRNVEHERRAKSDRNDDDSDFYDRYPHSTSKRADDDGADGLFEDLVQYVGASFDPTNEVMAICQKDYGDGGIFFYTEEERELVRNVNFRGRTKDEGFMEMVGYLFELGYDVALDRRANVSLSPGFEGCGLIFNKAAILQQRMSSI